MPRGEAALPRADTGPGAARLVAGWEPPASRGAEKRWNATAGPGSLCHEREWLAETAHERRSQRGGLAVTRRHTGGLCANGRRSLRDRCEGRYPSADRAIVQGMVGGVP